MIEELKQEFPSARISQCPVAIISVLGTNMKFPGFLSRAASALAGANINILALDQSMRQVNMQFIINREHFDDGIKALHKEFVETEK